MVNPPNSMDECIYFSNRTIGNGKVMSWVYRKECPECHKTTMGKPVVKGKVKIRATEYVCPECGFTEEKKEHEESLMLEATYTCPHCNKEGEGTTQYKRTPYPYETAAGKRKRVPAYIIECQHCKGKIPITKKLKEV